MSEKDLLARNFSHAVAEIRATIQAMASSNETHAISAITAAADLLLHQPSPQ
jgi:hypothetical protein